MPGKLIVDEIEDSGGTSVIGRKNAIINGNFDIWQRGTSVTGQTSDQYLADRWYFVDSGATYSYQQGSFTVGQTDVPNNPKYFANLTITGAEDSARLEQRIEDVYTFAGETVTLSFYAKYTSNAPTDFAVQIFQYFGSGGSTSVLTTAATGQTLTTSWQKFTYTISVPSISGKTVGSESYLTIRPVINTNNETFDYQLAQVQVEKGSVATDFEVRPIGEELALCHRYFQRLQNGTQTYVIWGSGVGVGTTAIRYYFNYLAETRIRPAISASGSWQGVGNVTKNHTGNAFARFNKNTAEFTATISSGTAGEAYLLRTNNDADAYIDIDAEL